MTVTQRARGRVPLDQRSVIPSVSGVPWWGALACAAIPITIGYLVDAIAGTELTMFFSTMFFLGCLAAVLAVQNKSLFTAMVQPPLLLIIAVPLAYKTFAVGPTQGLKSLVLDMALPLIDRFPTMAFTTAIVWIVGAFRLTMFIQERRGMQSASGRRRASTTTTRPTRREPVAAAADTRQPPARSRASAVLPSATVGASPGGVRDPAARPSAARAASAKAPDPRPAQPRQPQPRQPEPRQPEPPRGARRPRPSADEAPRARPARGHRYADEPELQGQPGQRRRSEPPRPAEPARSADPARRSTASRTSHQPPAHDEPTTGRRRRQQESVREFAERKGEVPRTRRSSQEPPHPEPPRPAPTGPDNLEPGDRRDYPRLPNVRYRD